MPELNVVPAAPPSPLMLCDRLIALAKEAERAGFAVTAEHLLHLVDAMFEEIPGVTERHSRGRA